MDLITEKLSVLCKVNSPVPIAYLNVYEVGDVWIKINSCNGCPPKSREKCCGSCPMITKIGCRLHLEDKGSKKPFRCIVNPIPTICLSWCLLEFKCIQGSKEGLIRKIREPGDVFR